MVNLGKKKATSEEHAEATLHPEAYKIHKESLELDGNPNDVRALYDKWATRYDEDVGNMSWICPKVMSTFLRTLFFTSSPEQRQKLKVIDVGCGSGQVGLELVRSLGFAHVDGFDLSQGMCDVARKLGVYGQLWGNADLNKRIEPVGDGAYDLAVSCGVFTAGHVPPSAFREVIRMLRKGGLFVVTTRKSYHEDQDVDSVIAAMEAEGLVAVVASVKDAAYCHDELGHYFAFKKL